MDTGNRILRTGNALAAAIVASTATAIVTLLPWLVTAPAILPIAAVIALVIASGHAVFVGAPLYLVVRCVWTLRWWNAALCGAAVGSGPFLLVTLAHADAPRHAIFEPQVAGMAAWFALVGMAGGLAFWFVLRKPPAVAVPRE